MNQTLIDSSLLVMALVTAILIVKTNRDRKYAIVPSLLLLFGPLVIFYNMWGHTVAVLIVNYKRYAAGNFQYNFHFYSLLLFGIIFILVSGINIDNARQVVSGDTSKKTIIHRLNVATSLLFLPLFVVNPIALLPVIASLISSATLILMKLRRLQPQSPGYPAAGSTSVG